jgi:hypothetical protein
VFLIGFRNYWVIGGGVFATASAYDYAGAGLACLVEGIALQIIGLSGWLGEVCEKIENAGRSKK